MLASCKTPRAAACRWSPEEAKTYLAYCNSLSQQRALQGWRVDVDYLEGEQDCPVPAELEPHRFSLRHRF